MKDTDQKCREELLPCPFCGGVAYYELTVVNNSVKCGDCSASIHGINGRDCQPLTEDYSVKFWNSRANTALTALREPSQELLDAVADVQANGWEYGTHPRDKATIVLRAIADKLGV